MSDEEFAAYYYKMHPEQVGQDANLDDEKNNLAIELDDHRRSIIQQSIFLDIVGSLAENPTGNESGGVGYPSYSESGTLTGEAGAFGPSISLTQDEDGKYILTFCNTRTEHYSSMGDSGTSTTKINHLNENQLTISDVMTGELAVDYILKQAETYYAAKYNFDFTNSAMGGVGSAMFGYFISEAADNFIGKIPIVGDIFTLIFDLGLGYATEKAQAEQDLEDINQSFDAISLANYCSALFIDVVIVNDGTAYQKIYMYPTENTPIILENINDLVRNKGKDLSKYGLSYPITLDDVLTKYSKVSDFLFNGLSSSEFALVVNPNN